MLKIVSEPGKLNIYQHQFIKEIESASNEKISCHVPNCPGGSNTQVNWLTKQGIWSYTKETDNLWWNAFGIGKPDYGENVTIACEINIPKQGINRHAAGGFVEDGGKVFVVHRGNQYGGHKPGMTKNHFWQSYWGKSQSIKDGDRVTVVAIISELGSRRLSFDVANFIVWIRGVQFSTLIQVLSEQELQLPILKQEWASSDESYIQRMNELCTYRDSLLSNSESEKKEKEISDVENHIKVEEEVRALGLEQRRKCYIQLIDNCINISKLGGNICKKLETMGRNNREGPVSVKLESDYYHK